MGMAASQARHIELCARKTNVEYEGQQINQQRTALANESAGLFNKMLQLQVPTAPNYSQYVKTIYSFNDGTNEYTIDSIARKATDPAYNCKVNYYTTEQEYTGMYKERSDLYLHWEQDSQGNKILYYGTKKLDDYDATTDEAAVRQIYLNTYENTTDHPTMDERMKTSYVGANYAVSIDPASTPDEKAAALAKIKKYQSGGTTYFVSADQISSGNKQVITEIDPEGATDRQTYITTIMYDGTRTIASRAYQDGDVLGKVISDTIKTSEPVQNCYAKDISVKKWQKEVNAYIDKDDSGNYSKITLENYSNTFDLSVYQETDDKAYNQAMNDYVYQKSVYDKNIADINAKTEIIQQEDRTLELKLKQLDTEHNALQTEIDAVKKVCDKNVEDTFKTFG